MKLRYVLLLLAASAPCTMHAKDWGQPNILQQEQPQQEWARRNVGTLATSGLLFTEAFRDWYNNAAKHESFFAYWKKVLKGYVNGNFFETLSDHPIFTALMLCNAHALYKEQVHPFIYPIQPPPQRQEKPQSLFSPETRVLLMEVKKDPSAANIELVAEDLIDAGIALIKKSQRGFTHVINAFFHALTTAEGKKIEAAARAAIAKLGTFTDNQQESFKEAMKKNLLLSDIIPIPTGFTFGNITRAVRDANFAIRMIYHITCVSNTLYNIANDPDNTTLAQLRAAFTTLKDAKKFLDDYQLLGREKLEKLFDVIKASARDAGMLQDNTTDQPSAANQANQALSQLSFDDFTRFQKHFNDALISNCMSKEDAELINGLSPETTTKVMEALRKKISEVNPISLIELSLVTILTKNSELLAQWNMMPVWLANMLKRCNTPQTAS